MIKSIQYRLVAVLSLTSGLLFALGYPQWSVAQQTTEPSPSAPEPTSTTQEQRHIPDPRQAAMAALAKSQSPDTEVLWLETQLESFLGLYHPANSANPIGAALILPHDRTSPDWPEMVHNIRTLLPDQQWHTLAIAMPEEPQEKPPTRGEENSADSSLQANPEPNSFKDKVFERIASAMAQLQTDQPKQVLVVGIGSGAYWASRYLSETNAPHNHMMVMIDARQPLNNPEPSLAEAVAKLNVPTADLLHAALPDRIQMLELAEKRQNQAKRDARRFYLYRAIPGRPRPRDDKDSVVMNTMRGIVSERLVKMMNEIQAYKTKEAKQQRPGG